MNDNQQKMIDEFRKSLTDLDENLEKIPEEGGLDWSEEGEWSIREVLHHLAEDCNVYAFIIEQGLAISDCKVFFGAFPGNLEWGKRLAFGERPVDNARALMHAHRAFLAELLGYFPDRWENKVNFYNTEGEKEADSTVGQMLVMLTEHMQEHTEMIRGIIEKHTAG
jgi:hypothetical protein